MSAARHARLLVLLAVGLALVIGPPLCLAQSDEPTDGLQCHKLTKVSLQQGGQEKHNDAANDEERHLAAILFEITMLDSSAPVALSSEVVYTPPGQTDDWHTVAQPNFLATRADVDADFVYLLAKTTYENLPFLQAIHKAANAMAIEKALAGLPLPLHPGAARYYKEVGIDIPAHLIVD